MGGVVSIYDPTDFNCYEIVGGNPPIRLDEYLTDEYFKSISLPNKSNFGSLDPVFVLNSDDNLAGEVLYLKSSLWGSNSQCDFLGKGDFMNVIGVFPDGALAFFNGNIKLEENTVDNPLILGGEYVADGAACPNTKMNFLNGEF